MEEKNINIEDFKSGQTGIHILMLEDNPFDAELIRYELKEAGLSFVLKRVETEDSYIEAIEEFCPDLILSDYDLPKYEGILALAEAKKQCPDVPFILVTGAVTEDRAIEVLTSGARDYVLKTRLNRLVPAVRRALAEWEDHRARKEAELDLLGSYAQMEKRVTERTAELEKARLDADRERSRLEAVLEALPIGAAITDVEGKTVHSNKAFELTWGGQCPVKRSAGKCPYKAYWVDSGKAVQSDEWASAIAVEKGESVYSQFMEIERFDGERLIVMNSASPVRDSRGNITGSAIAIQDVTWLYRAKEELRVSEEKYRLMFENSLSGVMVIRSDGGIVSANPAAEQILGMTEEEIIQLGRDGIVDMSNPRFAAALEARTRTGRFSGELKYRRRDGTIFPVEVFSALFRNSKKELYAVLQFQDVTWRKEAERNLMENEKRFREMADAMPQLVWTATPDGMIDYFNSRHEEICGIEQGETGFWDWRPAIHPDDLDATLQVWSRAIETGSANQVEHRLKHKNAGYRWCLSRGVPLPDTSGRLKKWIGTTTDIHELKGVEESLKESTSRLEEANRELESFSYSVSHDLRAPLRAICGFSGMLMEKEHTFDADTQLKIRSILESAAKMDGLINDLLSFSRSGQVHVSPNKIDMDQLAKELWREQLVAKEDRKIRFKSKDLPAAWGDAPLIRQVLSNLLANAVKFTKIRKTAVIEIGGEPGGKENIYYVRDNGTGFDMKYSGKLFGVFQRLHPEIYYEGSGIGLAIVQRIIHRHGGRVWAEGKVGRGATFYFTLPNH